MNVLLKKLFFISTLLISFMVLAKDNKRGETLKYLVSPFFMIQKSDSLLREKYIHVKKLFSEEKYDQSLKISLNALNSAKEKNVYELEYLYNFLIGDIFKKRNNHEKALFYFKNSLKNLKDNEESFIDGLGEYDNTLSSISSLSVSLLRVGTGFFKLNKKDSASSYYKRIIEIESIDNVQLLSVKAKAYNNLSAIHIQKREYELAKTYANKAIEIYKVRRDKVFEASAYSNLASIFLLEKKYSEAKEIYTKAIELIKNEKSIKAIKNKEDLFYNLAYTLYMQKDYTAYDYLEKSYIFKDTLTDREIKRIVKGVYAEYQEQYKVEVLKNKTAYEKAQERKTNWLLGALALLVTVVSGIFIYNYRLRQNYLKLKLNQTQSAQKSKLEKLKSESQVRILNATLDGKEAERKQIAETLHDSVSSLLSSANLHLQATKMQFNGDTPIEVDKTQKIIIEASQTIRDLSHTLVSSVLLKFGLNYAIKDMAEKYSNSQIQINTDIKNLRRYHQSFEIKVNNIIQEFVNNILKHSNAAKAIVRVEDKNGKLIISIQDNGDGFDKELIPEKDGLGINQIDARIQMMKGEFNINSSANSGTKIDIVLPILEKETTIRV